MEVPAVRQLAFAKHTVALIKVLYKINFWAELCRKVHVQGDVQSPVLQVSRRSVVLSL